MLDLSGSFRNNPLERTPRACPARRSSDTLVAGPRPNRSAREFIFFCGSFADVLLVKVQQRDWPESRTSRPRDASTECAARTMSVAKRPMTSWSSPPRTWSCARRRPRAPSRSRRASAATSRSRARGRHASGRERRWALRLDEPGPATNHSVEPTSGDCPGRGSHETLVRTSSGKTGTHSSV